MVAQQTKIGLLVIIRVTLDLLQLRPKSQWCRAKVSFLCIKHLLQAKTPPGVNSSMGFPHGKMVTTKRKSVVEILFIFDDFTLHMTRDSFAHDPKP